MISAFTLAILLFALPLTSNAQPLKESLFAEAEQTMAAAKKARADLLAPKNYGKALEHYNKAEKKFDNGDSIEDIRRELKQTVDYLKQALDATKLAEVTLTPTIQAREDAEKASAPQYSAKQWAEAEKKFAEAATELENGDVNDARKKGDEAVARYREAELNAIKSYLFNETRQLQRSADENKVQKYAPKTFAHSLTLLQQAEDALNKDRYDTDRPRIMAREAMYEAKHAVYIADLISNMEERKMTTEDLILASESPLERIAASIDVSAEFDNGYKKTTDMILEYIVTEHTKSERLSQEISDRKQNIVDLEQHIAALEAKLGGAKEEESILRDRIRAQEDVRQKFSQVETMFGQSEARVLREGNIVIIRLIGMNFEVGQSTIRPEHFELLSKIEKAILVFPGAGVRVEGHTDSYGSDESNLKLSQDRAEAVRLYLAANMGSGAPNMTSVGYGEARPIANNETKDGRATNRRIDIVILPHM
ncbi:MAG: OmpA family protein [Candidatus Krumholzibacteria bacterium]|nr:OmpA family protein [Candidatus Krumholzibacteria bacterium]